MPNMLKIIVLFLAFQAPASVYSQLELNRVFHASVYILECFSEKDIKFSFTSKDTDIKLEIAECARSGHSCWLYNQSYHGKLYACNAIEGGGQFVILEDNSKAYGQYMCCETDNTASCKSKEISSWIKEEHQTVDKEITVTKDIEHNVDTVIPVVVAVIGIVALVVIFGLVYAKKCPCLCFENCRKNTTQTQLETETSCNQEAMAAIETGGMRVSRLIVTTPEQSDLPMANLHG